MHVGGSFKKGSWDLYWFTVCDRRDTTTTTTTAAVLLEDLRFKSDLKNTYNMPDACLSKGKVKNNKHIEIYKSGGRRGVCDRSTRMAVGMEPGRGLGFKKSRSERRTYVMRKKE